MENPKKETLNLSEKPPFKFPPYRRRRPLKSRSFSTYIRILSECHLHLHKSEQVATIQGDRLVENNDLSIQGAQLVENNDSSIQGDQLVQNNDVSIQGDQLLKNNDSSIQGDQLLKNNGSSVQGEPVVENNNLSIQGDQSLENNDSRPEDGLAHEKSLVNENREVVSSQDPGSIGDHMDVDGLDSVDNVKSNGDQGNVDNINGMESAVVEGNQNCNNDFAAFASLIDSDDQFSLPDFDMEEFGLGEQLGEKAPCIDVSGLVDSLIDKDVTVGSSTPVDTKDKNSSPVERDETRTELEGRESDTPVSASVLVSSCLEKSVEGVEDREISEVSGVIEKSSDLLHEDVVSLEKNSVNKGHLSGDIIQKEGFIQNALQRGLEKDKQSFGLSIDDVNIMSTDMDVQMGNDNRNLVENRTKLVYYGDIGEDDSTGQKDTKLEFGRNRQRCGPKEANVPASCPKNISLSGGSTGENTIENQCSASTEKVANLNNKKRKRGGSAEGKAKIKKTERMKRAAKNRELGVKRLKLQPVSKPKTVTYCRHFLNGRCHEGEKCKFSHDTIPLTKSKPCCHFARQSCMKGDDCPYDHQLSKYPCNSYVSQGSCVRGSNCLFSHEVPDKEVGTSTASNICKPDLQSVSPKGNSSLKKQMNRKATSNPNVSAKLCSSGISSCKNEKQNGEGTTLRPAGQAPKGISFLSHEKVPVGNTSKHGQDALSLKAGNGAKVDQQTVAGALDVVKSLNRNTQRSPVVPRGVNFLSFGKAPFESSSTKKPSFSSISNVETGKSPLSDPGKSEQAGSSLKTDVGGKVYSQTGQGASSIAQNMNETANRTPAVTPRSLGFPSFANLLESSSNKKQAGSNLNEINAVHPTVNNNESVYNKHWSPNPVLPQVSSSPLPLDHSLAKLIDMQSKSSLSSSKGSFLSNTPSSVQKALHSTLAFAAKFESKAKKDRSHGAPSVSTDLSKEGSSSQNKSMTASRILDILYGKPSSK